MDEFLDWYPLGFSVFYPATAVYGRSWLLKRRTGISHTLVARADRRVRNFRHTIMFLLFHGTMIAVGLQAVMCTGLIPGYDRLWSLPGLVNPWIQFAGVLLTLVSWSMIWSAQESLGDSWRIGVDPTVDNKIKTGGLYTYIRHPIYTGLLGITVGLLLLMPTVLSLVTLGITFVGLRTEIALEEAHLLGAHGAAYRRYMDGTGKWLPRVGRRTVST
jgi:protein-S-isoprenylcysteine O-methyltransferase Ste14